MRNLTDPRSLPRRGMCVLCSQSIGFGDETTAVEGLMVHRGCFDRVMNDQRSSRDDVGHVRRGRPAPTPDFARRVSDEPDCQTSRYPRPG